MVPDRIFWLCKAVSLWKLYELALVSRVRMKQSIAIDVSRCEEEDIDLFSLRALPSFTKTSTDLTRRQEIMWGTMPVSKKLSAVAAE